MTATKETFTLWPNDSGGYDYFGEYFPASTAVVTDDINDLTNGLIFIPANTEDVFRTFSGVDIQNDIYGLANVSFAFTFTLGNADVDTQPINVELGQFATSDQQAQIESNETTPAGIGGPDSEADNFSILDEYTRGDTTVNVQAGTVTTSTTESGENIAGGPLSSNDLIAGFSVGIPPGSTQYAGLTYVSDVSLTVTGTAYTNLPVITGTQLLRAALDDVSFRPFANVTLQDPGNPSGQGDTITIIIEHAASVGLSDLGTFSLPANFTPPALANGGPSPAVVSLVQGEQGLFTLTATSAYATTALQAALDALIYTPATNTSGAPETLTFEISYNSVGGTQGSTLDGTTTVVISHDQVTISGIGTTIGSDQAPFAVFSGVSVVASTSTVSATLSLQPSEGTLSGSGLTDEGNGTYSVAAGSVDSLNADLQTLMVEATPGSPVGTVDTAAVNLTVTEIASGETLASASASQTLEITAHAATPAIAGTQPVVNGTSAAPYLVLPNVSVSVNEYDPTESAVLIVRTVSGSGPDAGGTLSGAGLTQGAVTNGAISYSLDLDTPLTPAALAAALQGVSFTATTGVLPVGSIALSDITLDVLDASGGLTGSATEELQTDYTPATPVIANVRSTQPLSDQITLRPFGAISVTLADASPRVGATITSNDAEGMLTGTGLTESAPGRYSLVATTPATLTTELQSLVFTPLAGLAPDGGTTSDLLTLTVTDTSYNEQASAQTTLDIAALHAIPAIKGAVNTTAAPGVASNPLSSVTLVDPTQDAVETLSIHFITRDTVLLTGTGVQLTAADSYELQGSAGAVNADLAGLSFVDATPSAASPVSVTLSDASSDARGVLMSGSTSFEITEGGVACYCPGTHILTESGEVAVERLAIGDPVVTGTGAVEPIRWIGRRSYAGRFLAGRPHLHPVRILAGSMGNGLPHRDLRVSPEHALLLDGVLVAVRHLVNGTTVIHEHGADRVDYVHIELAQHDILLAEGIPAESFVDDNGRAKFQNASDYALLYLDSVQPEAWYAAPRVEGGYRFEAIRRRLVTAACAAV